MNRRFAPASIKTRLALWYTTLLFVILVVISGLSYSLLARVRALLRRGSGQRSPLLQIADLTLDPARRAVHRGSRRITLTTREYALLEYFLRNAGRVLTRATLAEHVWGVDFDTESNIIDVYVGYLRRKIDAPGEGRLLHTVRGAGYVLKAEDA